MSEFGTTDSVKDVLRFPFEGPEWQSRLLVGVGLTLANFLLPLVPAIFVSGYTLRVMRQAVRGEKLELPPWDDWGEMAKDGLRLLLVNLAYLAPGFLVIFGGMMLFFALTFGFPMLFVFMAEVGETSSPVALLMPLVFVLGMTLLFGSMAVGWLLYMLGGVPLPVAKAHFVAQGEVAAAFRVREWWAILRGNKLGYFVGWVVVVGLFAMWYVVVILVNQTLILSPLVPFLALPFWFYLSLVNAAVFGQVYRESVELEAGSGE